MGASNSDASASESEKPQHRIRITSPFYLSICPVTQRQFKLVLGETPSEFKGDGQFPVESVSWFDAIRFCNRLSELQCIEPCYLINDAHSVAIRGGNGYRLPSEAEWEYACRAGTTTLWSCGNESHRLQEYAWYSANSNGTPHPVAEKLPNCWGIFDMHGNVREWCWDWFAAGYYQYSPADNPAGPSDGKCRVVRGGSWRSFPAGCRAACRVGYEPESSYAYVGFRVAATLSPTSAHSVEC